MVVLVSTDVLTLQACRGRSGKPCRFWLEGLPSYLNELSYSKVETLFFMVAQRYSLCFQSRRTKPVGRDLRNTQLSKMYVVRVRLCIFGGLSLV